jgi:hypothetical protein
MPINRYPRHGFPLAPKALGTILGVRIPKKLFDGAKSNAVELCDLDKSAWEAFSPEACRNLGREIVEAVRAAISTMSESLLESCLQTQRPKLGATNI